MFLRAPEGRERKIAISGVHSCKFFDNNPVFLARVCVWGKEGEVAVFVYFLFVFFLIFGRCMGGGVAPTSGASLGYFTSSKALAHPKVGVEGGRGDKALIRDHSF